MNRIRLLAAAALAAAFLCAPGRAHAAAGESSFTPTSLKLPLHGVRIGGADMNKDASLYRCAADKVYDLPDAGPPPSTAADCMVDLADDTALAALFGGAADVAPGTYDHVSFDTCDRGAHEYTAYVAGTMDLAGVTRHTTSGLGDLLTGDASLSAPVPLVFAGCSTTIPLPTPVTIAEGDTVVVSSFFSLANIAWAALSPSSMGGCASTTSESVCAAMPVPVTYLGDYTPRVETYYITEDVLDLDGAKAGGQILLLLDPVGDPFGGFARRLYSPLSVLPRVNFDTPIKEVVKNTTASPTFTISTWGGGSPSGEPSPYYIKFTAFELATHDATLLGPDSPDAIAYRAVKQP